MFTKRLYILLMTLSINTSLLTAIPVAVATGTLSQTCSTSSVTIPNNTPAGVTQTLNVTEGGSINDLNVTLDVTHAQVSELAVTLKQVTTGKTLLLFNQPGMASPPGCLGQNFTGFVIDEQGTKDVDSDCGTTNPAYNSSFQYKPSVASLALFNGEIINGAWELTVSDSFNYSTTNGTLTKWCLKYDRQSAAASVTLSPPNGSTLFVSSAGSPLGTPIYDTINIPETSNLDDLWVYSYAITGDNASEFKLVDPTSFAFKVAQNTLYKFKVECKPTAPGTRTATITLNTNITGMQTISYQMQCVGIAASYSDGGASATMDLGSSNVNIPSSLSSQPLTIYETGNSATLTVTTSLSGDTGDFSVSPNCSSPCTIGKGTSQAFSIGCTPKAGQPRSATLKFTTNDPAKPTVNYTLNCLGIGPIVTSTPADNATLQFGAVQISGAGLAKGVSLSNGGNQAMNLSAADFSNYSGAGAGAFSFSLAIPTNVLPGDSVSPTVTCNPPAAGSYSATLKITTDDPNNPDITYILKCSGNTVTEPLYDSTLVLPTQSFNVGNAELGGTISNFIYVEEVGNATLNVDVVPAPVFTGTDASAFSVTGLPFSIPDNLLGTQETITVTCAPSHFGAHTATLNLTSNATNYPTPTYPVTCTGLQPGYGSSPAAPGGTITFANTPVGNIANYTLNVQETGPAKLTVNQATPVITGANDTEFAVTTTFPFSINNNDGPKAVNLTCSPKDLGVRTAQLNLTSDDDTKQTITYTLNCTGLQAVGPGYGSTPIWSGDDVDVGNVLVGVPTTATFEVKELGSAVLEVNKTTNATITGANAGDFSVSPNNYFFIPDGGANKTVTVTCTHSGGTPGTVHTATLNMTSTDTKNLTPKYNLKCTAKATPKYGSTPVAPGNTINFGTTNWVGKEVTKTLTIQELGTADLTVNLAATPITGTHAEYFSVVATTFPLTIPENSGPGPTVTLQCRPKSPLVIHTALLNLVTNDPLNPTVTYPLSCTGKPTPGYGSSPVVPGDTIDFGNSPVGVPVMKTFNLQEVGSADLTIDLPTTAITGPDAADFSLVTSAFPVIIPEASGLLKNVIVQCKPSQAKALTATLTLTSNDPVASSPLYTLKCNGTPLTLPLTPSNSTLLPVAGVTLMVSIQGTGNGTVNSHLPGIHCEGNQGTCNSLYQPPTSVILTPIPVEGSEFSSWGGDEDCADGQLTMNGNKLCIAYFKLTATAPVPVMTPIPPTTQPTLTTQPTPTAQTTPTAPGQVTLTVQKIGSGSGQWTIENEMVDHGPWSYHLNTKVTIIAIPNPGSIFKGWSGDCNNVDNSITVTMSQAMNCVAQFDLLPPTPVAHHLLSVVKTGAGQGKVVNAPVQCDGECHAGGAATEDQQTMLNTVIDCGDHGSKCQATYPQATSITLMAQAETNSTFTGWSGDCVGATSVDTTHLSWSLLMDHDQQCIAQFDLVTPELPTTVPLPVPVPVPSTTVTPETVVEVSLTMSITGSCTGNISSYPEEMLLTTPDSPTSPRTMTYPVNTVITFIATPEPGCQWLNFGGDEDCFDGQVTLGKNLSCTAIFEPVPAPAAATPAVKEEPIVVCPLTGSVDIYCNYRGQSATDLTVTTDGNISNVILDGTINNNGWISNATIKASATLVGGALTGYITNEGIAMDFEFHGALFSGGWLAGNIINKDRGKFKDGGIIQDVKLAPNSYLSGGKLRGHIEGDAELPVLVESVKILRGSVLTNVILGANVVLEDNVTLGPGVIWLHPPTGTTSPVPDHNRPGETNGANNSDAPTLINDTIDGQGRVMKNLTIGPNGKLRNVILQGNIINQGVLEDATLQDCTLTGGILAGVIRNECTLTDVDFQGTELSGGILAGKIKISRAGTVKNVTLAPHTSLTGGKLSGLVKGDSVAPALLESVTIDPEGYVENVIVGPNVKNRGTLANIEFRGDLMSGGTLAGTIQNTGDGLIQNVKFNENAHLLGGKVGGSLAGTPHAPALIENVNAQALTAVKYVNFKQAKALKLKHLDVGPEVTVLKLDTTDTKVNYTEANGEIMTDVVVGTLSRLANAQLQGTIINRGEIANITLLRAESTLTGGILTGEIINQGTLIDVEFAGTTLTGGWLRGIIRNTKGGLIKTVRLAANAQIKGGKLQGQILGEATAPALLEDLTILAGSEIDNVIIGENVAVSGAVTFGPKVKFIRQPTESTLRLITDQQEAKNERWQDIMVGPQGQISNVTLAGTTLNQGVINEASTVLGSTVMGGILSGRIMNQGTLSDFEFQGTEITGGLLGGKIKVTRNGILYNVRLLGKAYLVGGWLKGRIEGDVENPPLLENVTVLESGYVNNVIIGDNIENHGTLANFEFRGQLLSGGKVAGSIDGNKNGALQNLTLVAGTELRGMRLKGRIKGEAWAAAVLENVQIDSDGEVENVIVGDNVTNDGTLMNIEFRGQFLKNGRLAGKIVNTKKGILQDSRLAANAYLTGGSVQGQILGESSDAPALLENLIVTVGTVLDNVIIGDNVTLPKTVSYGKGVRFLKVRAQYVQYVQAQELTAVTLAESDLFTNVVLQGTNRNRGRIYNMTLRSNSVLSGGRLSGIVYNEGSLLDFEFEGTLLQGGKLGGTVKNTRGGIIKAVTLMAKARLRGGQLQGRIVGEDVETSALLEEVTILDGSFIDNVIIGERVTMEQAVTFGPQVKSLKQPAPRTTVTINEVFDGKGQLFTAVTIGPQGKLTNAVLAGCIINQGVLDNVTVQADGIITGGILTGVIVNQGSLSDFEFQGSQLTGGTLSGVIRNTKDGIFQDVKLAPNTWLTGGKLRGRIEGSPGAMALLEQVTILEYSYVIYVIVGQWVKNYGTLVNFEFRGDLLIGGKLEGMITITSAGVFQDTILAANAVLRGGHLRGKIMGDAKAPALLEHLLIERESLVENVIIGEQVVNQGTLTNFELRGGLTGGTVAGNIKVTNFGTLRNVYLAANAKVTGGRLAGVIKGDSVAPALLDEVEVMGLSYLENVTLTATSKISPYVTFGTQVLTSSSVITHKTSKHAGIGIDANGHVIETQAQFISTMKTSKGEVENRSELSLAEAKKVKLTITLAIDPQHQGQPGEIIVTSIAKQIGQEGTFMRPPVVQGQWLPWDEDPAKLQPMAVYDSLPSVVTVNVFEGDLTQMPGELTASAGYRLVDGTIIYNQVPTKVSVPLAESCLACHTVPPPDEEMH